MRISFFNKENRSIHFPLTFYVQQAKYCYERKTKAMKKIEINRSKLVALNRIVVLFTTVLNTVLGKFIKRKERI